MISTLLVDYAGVLTPTKNNLPFAEKYHKEYNLSPETLMELSYTNWEKAATGELNSQLYWEKVASLLKTDPRVLRDRIMSTYPLDKRVITLLEKLTKQYTLVLVSNQIQDWLEEVIDKNSLRTIFNYTANSYEVGVRKPNPKIFKHALNLAESKPREAVFIDDTAKNISAAQELGMQTIQFSNFENFKETLSSLLKTV